MATTQPIVEVLPDAQALAERAANRLSLPRRLYERDALKCAAARRAAKEVENGMVVGLGSESTAVVATGLFIGLASQMVVGRPAGGEVMRR